METANYMVFIFRNRRYFITGNQIDIKSFNNEKYKMTYVKNPHCTFISNFKNICKYIIPWKSSKIVTHKCYKIAKFP